MNFDVLKTQPTRIIRIIHPVRAAADGLGVFTAHAFDLSLLKQMVRCVSFGIFCFPFFSYFQFYFDCIVAVRFMHSSSLIISHATTNVDIKMWRTSASENLSWNINIHNAHCGSVSWFQEQKWRKTDVFFRLYIFTECMKFQRNNFLKKYTNKRIWKERRQA